METGKTIREMRTRAGMSQDDLAARVYVSRQTISSWENGKTYPDLQSLLILSEAFGASIDEIVKGDVAIMEKAVERNIRTIKYLGLAMAVFLVVILGALAWFVVQVVSWGWTIQQTLPTLVLAAVSYGAAMMAAKWAECLRRDEDLATYSEVVSFVKGEAVERNPERRRAEQMAPARWVTAIKAVGTVLLIIMVALAVLKVAWGIDVFGMVLGS